MLGFPEAPAGQVGEGGGDHVGLCGRRPGPLSTPKALLSNLYPRVLLPLPRICTRQPVTPLSVAGTRPQDKAVHMEKATEPVCSPELRIAGEAEMAPSPQASPGASSFLTNWTGVNQIKVLKT